MYQHTGIVLSIADLRDLLLDILYESIALAGAFKVSEGTIGSLEKPSASLDLF